MQSLDLSAVKERVCVCVRAKESERDRESEREKNDTKMEEKKKLAKAHSLATGLYSVEHVSMEMYQSGMCMSVAHSQRFKRRQHTRHSHLKPSSVIRSTNAGKVQTLTHISCPILHYDAVDGQSDLNSLDSYCAEI